MGVADYSARFLRRQPKTQDQRRADKRQATLTYRKALAARGVPENRTIASALLSATVTFPLPEFSQVDSGIIERAVKMLVDAGYDRAAVVERLKSLRDRLSEPSNSQK